MQLPGTKTLPRISRTYADYYAVKWDTLTFALASFVSFVFLRYFVSTVLIGKLGHYHFMVGFDSPIASVLQISNFRFLRKIP